MSDEAVAASEQARSKARRTRCAYVYFTADEWAKVQARMRASDAKTFSDWARRQLLGRQTPTKADRRHQGEAVRQMAGVCTNLNQIARYVNTERYASLDQVWLAISLAKQARDLVENAWKPLEQASHEGV